MAPDVKIRDLDPETYDRLQERARRNGRSMEAELRRIVADSLESGVSAEEWAAAGFEQAAEIVPGRIFEVWAKNICYRISITRAILSGSSIEWNSSIDMLETRYTFGPGSEHVQVWTSPTGIANRLRGSTPELALRDAMRWLSIDVGVDGVSKARKSARKKP